MPFYQMLCITVHLNFMHTKSLVHQVCTHILDAGSIVRRIESLGPRHLPQRMKRHGQYHTKGDLWRVQFDTSPATVRSLNSLMQREPRVIRWMVLKIGDRPQDILHDDSRTVFPVSYPTSSHLRDHSTPDI